MARSGSSGAPAGTAVRNRFGSPGRAPGRASDGGGALARRNRPAISAASAGEVPAHLESIQPLQQAVVAGAQGFELGPTQDDSISRRLVIRFCVVFQIVGEE